MRRKNMTRRHESMSTNFDRLTVNTIRTLVADAVQKANSGHPGLGYRCSTDGSFRFQANAAQPRANPSWRGRDRFVLSAGHAPCLSIRFFTFSAMMYQLTTSRISVSSAAKRQGTRVRQHCGNRSHNRPARAGICNGCRHGDGREASRFGIQPR